MVNSMGIFQQFQRLRISLQFSLTLLAMTLMGLSNTGCSPQKWWGEKAITFDLSQSKQSGASCPELPTLLTGTENQSQETLDCWARQVNEIWSQVQGDKNGALSEPEIATLIRKKILKIPGPTEEAIRRAFTIKRLLGMNQDLSKRELDEWIHWIRLNRPQARALYEKLSQKTPSYISFNDIQDSLRIFSSLLRRLKWSLNSYEFSQAIATTFDVQDPDLLKAVEPASEVVINFFNMACPTFRERDIWAPENMASCLDLMTQKFQVGAAWFEFLLNPVQDLSPSQIQKIRSSLNQLSTEVSAWFNSPFLTPLYPTRWLELSRKMKAHPPANFMDSLRIIRRFKRRSNEEVVYPEGMIRLFGIVARAQDQILEGIEPFVTATQQRRCSNSDAKHWTQCILPNYSIEIEKSEAIKTAWRVKNLNYGQKTSPLNGREFAKISFFHELSGQIMELFHDECSEPPHPQEKVERWINPSLFAPRKCDPNFITTDVGDDKDKLVQLITVGVDTTETLKQFIENIQRKIQHRPFKESNSFLDRRWNIAGFARLIAITSDLLVKRTQEETTILNDLMSMVVLPNKTSLSLDRLAVTAILTMVDSLPKFRESYFSLIDEENHWIERDPTYSIDPDDRALKIRRDSVIQKLPILLSENFPRTYESCNAFGFAKSCEIVFDKVLPQAPKGSQYISSPDLDILTILATAVEGLVDSCDRDHDSQLHATLWSGDDELDCGYARTQDILKRLMDSRVVDMSSGDQERAKLILGFINATPVTRINGKVAMARGSSEYLMANILWAPFYFSPLASIGSIHGLIADIADPQRTRK